MLVAANRTILNHTLTTKFFRHPRKCSGHLQWYELHAPTVAYLLQLMSALVAEMWPQPVQHEMLHAEV